jgi:predicted DNA-binding transcriptional regulator YafY
MRAMPKHTETLETTLLTLEILRHIPRNRLISARELHEKVTAAGISRDVRTIQRILEMLTEHFDIERDDRSKPYGYRWKALSQGLALPFLSEHESLLLTLAEEHLHHLLPAKLMNTMGSFFEQARRNLTPDKASAGAKEWLKKIRVISTTQPLLPPSIRTGVMKAVSNALYGNFWLDIVYQNASGKNSTTDVMPLGLAQQGPRLYLVCRFRNFDNERTLAIHRIVSAKVSTLTFERPKSFDLAKYDDEGRFGFGNGTRITLSFRIQKDAGRHLLESPLSTDQVVTEKGDLFHIQATVVDTALLERWLRGFGDQISHITRKKIAA